jgi:O-antigen/teichoic acid export membrane protein
VQTTKLHKPIAWSLTGVGISRAIALLGQWLVLTFLSPRDLGTFSYALFYIAIIRSVLDIGYSAALIQKDERQLTPGYAASVHWLTVLSSIAVTVVILLCPVAVFDLLGLEPVLSRAIACILPLHAMTVTREALLVRALDFSPIAKIEIGSTIIGILGGVLAAAHGFGVGALAVQLLLINCVRTISFARASEWVPTRVRSLDLLLNSRGYALSTAGTRLMVALRTSIDRVLVKVFVGETGLGLYVLAQSIVEGLRVPGSQFLSRVIFPALAAARNDRNLMHSYFFKTTVYSTVVSSVSIILLWVFSSDLLSMVFGEQWSSAIKPLYILGLTWLAFTAFGPSPEVLQASGAAGLMFKLSVLSLCCVLIPATSLGALYFDVTGAAIGVTVSFFLQRFLLLLEARRILAYTWTQHLRATLIGVTPGILLGMLAWYLQW